jgi:hypothetical protein
LRYVGPTVPLLTMTLPLSQHPTIIVERRTICLLKETI